MNIQFSNNLKIRVWRWHFFAGLMVLPFAIVLAITGAIYLFNTQYNDFVDTQLAKTRNTVFIDSETPQELPRSYASLLGVFQEKFPDAKLVKVVLPKQELAIVKIEALLGSKKQTFWIDQYSASILHKIATENRLMVFVKKLHGELMGGDLGSLIVEFMAVWMIALIFTGYYMWFNNRPVSTNGRGRVKKAFLDIG